MSIKLKEDEYYWLNAPAIDDEEPLMIGRYSVSGTYERWWINGSPYTFGIGIHIIKHISRPRRIK